MGWVRVTEPQESCLAAAEPQAKVLVPVQTGCPLAEVRVAWSRPLL